MQPLAEGEQRRLFGAGGTIFEIPVFPFGRDTLNHAYGQRQVTQYFTQLNTYWIILEVPPDLQDSFASLDRIYVKSPLTGQAVPLSMLVHIDRDRVGHSGEISRWVVHVFLAAPDDYPLSPK